MVEGQMEEPYLPIEVREEMEDGLAQGKVAQIIDIIRLPYHAVPGVDHRFIHLLHGDKWAIAGPDDIRVVEVMVGRKERRHILKC